MINQSDSFHETVNRQERGWRHTLRTRLRGAEIVSLVTFAIFALLYTGFPDSPQSRWTPLGMILVMNMIGLALIRGLRFMALRASERTWAAVVAEGLLLPAVWGIAAILSLTTGALYSSSITQEVTVINVTLLFGSLAALLLLFEAGRMLAERTQNSALLLSGSFVVLITIGTLLLRLPASRAPLPDGSTVAAPWNVALFTSTSACCVTGLIVEPTGSFWSSFGHAVIAALIQLGGLGILTFGAFIAVLSGRRGLHFREAATFRDLLDTESLQASRRLLVTILLFTLTVEGIGAVSLVGLWPEAPWPKKAWYAVFHSVSAFCNAGFSLHDEGLLNKATWWQVWGPVCFLIICGGLGFQVAGEIAASVRSAVVGIWRRHYWRPHSRTRLSVHSRIVVVTTVWLLLMGTIGFGLIETMKSGTESHSWTRQLADAWFQSVTFRTAGFNTVDMAGMHPATKLMGVVLMFIGASPGSTGGGVKTVVFAIVVMNLWSVLRGREGVEVFGRRIPSNQIGRSLCVVAVGMVVVLVTTGLLAMFEDRPDQFLDHLYEATSAFATVGVSTGITPTLSIPSRLLLTLVMFLGRVGPMTMLLAMVGNSEPVKYEYPEERVSLG
ncbi:MAG: potassium-transporting ATPase subunit KdpA [Planctomyces sp.]|nr:potassium-transporting ATPase subunit KdpA [Planctomyces sp.]